MTAQPLFPSWFNPHRKGPKAPKRKMFAIFPDGSEVEIVKTVSPISGRRAVYRIDQPNGKRRENTVLKDLRHFLEMDFPGVTFQSRAASK